MVRIAKGRKLLEWRTASAAERAARVDLAGFYYSMWVLPGLAVVAALILGVARHRALEVGGAPDGALGGHSGVGVVVESPDCSPATTAIG